MSASRIIYLDNHATTPIDPRVFQRIVPWMISSFGNAHSREHVFGQEAAEAVEAARAEVAALVGAAPDQVVFTSGATESVNLALMGYCVQQYERRQGARIALPPTEHSAVVETCRELQRRRLAELRWLAVDSLGRLELEDLKAACDEGANLVCVMGANNEIGNIYPIELIGALAARNDVPVFCDGCQAVGRIAIDFDHSMLSFLTISAHKMYGPKGVGALVVRNPADIKPLLYGGQQERGLRPGTLNVPGIVGLGQACRLRRTEMSCDEAAIQRRRDHLQLLLIDTIPDIKVNGDTGNRLAGNLHVAVRDTPSDAIIARSRDHLAISTGAACSSGSLSASHVLRSIGLASEWIDGALRIGIGKFNTDHEMDEAAQLLQRAIADVRSAL